MKVCVVIPTYNESKTIGNIVSRIKEEGFDTLIVDDGSCDNTAKIAEESGAYVIVFKKNKGKGASLKAGFEYALREKYDSVVVMDGDGQHDPKDIKRFIQTAESTGADLIIGDRMSDTKSMPFIRWLTNKYMSVFISWLSGRKIPDTQCGFRFIKTNLLKNIKLISSKYETESEILIRACKKKYKIISIPIKSIYNNEISSIRPLRDTLRFIRLIINLCIEKFKKKILP